MIEELARNEYAQLLHSGMFWEFFPELTGEWERDRDAYLKFYVARETQKALG